MWLLTVNGYGRWLCYGTRKQAEQRVADKADWEGGTARPVVDVTDAVDACTRNMVRKLVDWLRANPKLSGEKAAQRLMKDFTGDTATPQSVLTFSLNEQDLLDV